MWYMISTNEKIIKESSAGVRIGLIKTGDGLFSLTVASSLDRAGLEAVAVCRSLISSMLCDQDL